MIYLYALALDLSDLSGLIGVQGEALALFPFAPAIAVGGQVDAAPALDAATLVAQDALVRSLHARAGAVLPMRFGTTMPDVAAIARAVLLHEAALRERLQEVRGCEQMTVRVLGAGGAEGAGGAGRAKGAGSAKGAEGAEGAMREVSPKLAHESSRAKAGAGREYMEARAALRAPSPGLDAIARAAGALQRGVRIDPVHRGGIEGSVYHLIEKGRAAQYREAIEAAASRERVRVLITGPSPPYAFAELGN